MPLRVVHLVGSAVSDELADLSRLYASDCLEATADPERHEAVVAYVSPDGRWRFPPDLADASIAAAEAQPVAAALRHLVALRPDAMVPHMFCVPGMTHYRALFDVLGVPYVGNAPGVMALTAHKARAKAVVGAAGVRTADGEVLRPGDRPTVAPAVVKPVDVDNSQGVAFVADATGWDAGLGGAFAHADEALVEAYVPLGREVRCGIVVRDGRLVCLPLEEYALDTIRTGADKLARDEAGELRLVAKERARAWIVDGADPVTATVWDAARRCHVALGCRDYSLFDFRIDPQGRPWFLEAGLYCSFARQSVVAVMARAAGIPTEELFRMALTTAIEGTPMNHDVLDPVGARVTGLRLDALSPQDVTELGALLADHGVLVFPRQELDDGSFVAFLRAFGELAFTKGEAHAPGFPDLNVVSNVGRTTPPRSVFHVDTSYVRRPPAYTALRAVSIPAQGGETLFTNQYRAYETLPTDVRDRLDGRTITHVVTGVELDDGDESAAEHPVFRPHPLTGRIALYLSTPQRCRSVSGMSGEEAERMVAELFDHSTREDNVRRHAWAPGDVVMWDNACVLHRADHAGVVGDRVMHRGMVAAHRRR